MLLRIRTRRADQDGAISIMAAMLVLALLASTALAVDVGRVAFTSRDQQGVTDRAVLDAMGHLGDKLPPGATLEDILEIVVASVDTTLEGNTDGSSVGTARDRHVHQIEIGFQHPLCVYNSADPQPGDPEEFCVMFGRTADGATFDGPYRSYFDLGQSVTAVRVVTASTVDYMFAIGGAGDRDVFKQSMATIRRTSNDCPPPPSPDPCEVDTLAAISIRSRLVELDSNNSPLLREVFGELLGMSDPTTLSLVGFDGLADARVPLDALGGAGANVGSVDQLLDSEVHVWRLFEAMIAGATSEDPAVTASAQTALGTLQAFVDPDFTVRVGDMIDATTDDPNALLTAQVDALTLVMHALLNAAVADGRNLINVSLTGSGLLGLNGLLGVTAQLSLIEAPQMAFGPVRWDEDEQRYTTVARTAQVSTGATLNVSTSQATSLVGPLDSLLGSLLCVVPVLCPSSQSVEVSVGAAQAQADLAGITCQDPSELTSLTTVVRSDALIASAGSGELELATGHDPESAVVEIHGVPADGEATVSDSTLTSVPVLDELLTPVYDLLGLGTGTARVASHWVNCEVPVLMANPVPVAE